MLENRITALPLEIQQIIVTKVWQNKTIVDGTEEIKDFSNFVEKDYKTSRLHQMFQTPSQITSNKIWPSPSSS